MANQFLERLLSGQIMVADGATATNYQHNGLRAGVTPEDWILDEPEKVLGLHRAFIEAGADIILTDTFGGTGIRMRGSKYEDRARDVNRRAAELAQQAAAEKPGVLVAGSMGPTGSLLQPLGDLNYEAVAETYAEQAAALAAGGVDFLLIETMFAMEEALPAIAGARRGSDLPIVCSFSFDVGAFTMMGIRPAQVVETLAPLGLAAIGINCGKSLDDNEQVLRQMIAVELPVPLWVKPNAGLPIVGTLPPEYEVGPQQMAEYALRFVRAGAQIVGGCCGTTPEHVRAIAHAIRARGAVRDSAQ